MEKKKKRDKESKIKRMKCYNAELFGVSERTEARDNTVHCRMGFD